MTPDELEAIRARDADYLRGLRDTGYDPVFHPEDECEADKDRHALLAEVDRLTALIARWGTTDEAAVAVLNERARILAAVEGLPTFDDGTAVSLLKDIRLPFVDRAAVIAAIEGEAT